MVSRILSVLSLIALLCCACLMVGCDPSAQAAEPIERVADRGFDTIDKWSEKARSELTTNTSYIAGGAEVIEPGYRLEFEGVMVNGFRGSAEVKARGVAGRFSGHIQSDRGQESEDKRPVGDRRPTTQPQ